MNSWVVGENYKGTVNWEAWLGGVVGVDDNIYGVPLGQNKWLKIYIATDTTSLVRNDVSVLGSFDGGGFVVGLDCNIYNIPQDASGGFIEPNHDNLGHWGSSNNNSNNNGTSSREN